MKIAVFTDLFLPINSGVATSIVNSSKWLASRGHEIMIFTPGSPHSQRVDLGKNIKIDFCKPLKNLVLIKYSDMFFGQPGYSTFRALKTFKPDIIHSHMPSPLGWSAIFFAKVLRIPIVGTFHGFLPDFSEYITLPKKIVRSKMANRFLWTYLERFYNSCDLIIVPTNSTMEELKRHNFRKPIKVVSNGVNLSRFHHVPSARSNTVLHIGRLSYEKRIEVVIRAFKALKSKAKLIIIGKGPDEKRLKKEAGLLLGKSICFKGHIDHDKLVEYYSKAKVFATASTIETEGLVILEAMACGTPIVGVDVRAIPDIVRHGRNGFVARAFDHQGMASYIDQILDDEILRKRMSRNSISDVKKFSIELTAKKLESAYKSVVRKKLEFI